MLFTNRKEYESLRSQFVTLNQTGRGQHKKYLPNVFTERGIAILSRLLKSDKAIEISILIIKAFIAMRNFLRSNGQIFDRLTTMEYKLLDHEKKFNLIFDQL